MADLTRRTVLGAIGVAGVAAAAPASAWSTGTPRLRTAADASPTLVRGATFPEGIMAGVPRTDGATLWTRVPCGVFDGDAELAVVVSQQRDLSRPEIVATVIAEKRWDGCVHFPATGLTAGAEYFYQFRGQDTVSPVGRFQTLRPADSNQPVRIGFFTCQGFTEGYYATHRHLAAEELDLVVGLGDYVYEATVPGVRGIDLNLYPQVLSSMRAKYTLYRSDPNLRAMHAQHAFLPLWDDHEFRNNYSKDNWTLPELFFQEKKSAAWHAWFERMPVPRYGGDLTRTYRSLKLGRTVELFAIDNRQYKDDQPCEDGGSIVCAAADAPARSMLGPAQKTWLKDGLRSSGARWKVLANPNMMMGMVTGAAGERAFMDTWDGYGAERTELLSLAAERVSDLVMVTGDDHDTFAGELWDTGFAPGSPGAGNPGGTRRAGVEFVVPSVSSTNTGDTKGVTGAKAEEQKRLQYNPHLNLIDMRQHGYGVLEVTQDEAKLAYRAVNRLQANAGVSTSYQARTARGSSTVEVI
ncbi:alkaline phosphatase D family protein [Kribbella sp. CA-294648]|uniref:alkaline phosphatase D family protein n=1 Tax=Kribbella sp. CA-294648 TaxID=3239948 RepID=UPI003D8FE48B